MGFASAYVAELWNANKGHKLAKEIGGASFALLRLWETQIVNKVGLVKMSSLNIFLFFWSFKNCLY